MKGINPVPRSTQRMKPMVAKELAKHEELRAAVPVWIGGTYVPFLGGVVIGIAVGTTVAASAGGQNIVFAALGGAIGAVVGRWFGRRRSVNHPVRSRALQVFLGVTSMRVLIHEPSGFGKPGKLLAAFPIAQMSNITVDQGGILRPSRLSFGVSAVEQIYEYSGLWNISEVLAALGVSPGGADPDRAGPDQASDDHKPS